MKTKAIKWIIIALIMFMLPACNSSCLNTQEVRESLHQKLAIGDTREQVAETLNKLGISFSYDRFQNQYHSTIRYKRCGPYQAISVDISFDESEKLSNIEVFESYTMP